MNVFPSGDGIYCQGRDLQSTAITTLFMLYSPVIYKTVLF